MKKASIGDWLRYRFDNFMSRGTGALIGALFAVTSLLILVATLILVLARISPGGGTNTLNFVEAFFQVAMRTIDTGTMAGDTGWSFRLVSFVTTLCGIFIASTLIGILASGIEGRLANLRRGRSRVVETGHMVILGWSPQVFAIVSEFAHANRYRRHKRGPSASGRSACVVILADKDKVEMEEEIRTKVPDTMGTRVVCRSGNPLDLDELEIVSPDSAHAMIIVSPGGQHPDLPVHKTLMALVKNRDRRTHRYHIVAAVHTPTNLRIARLIGGDESQIFMVDNLISRIIAQTCRQSGLSVVYTELFSFEGEAIHFLEEPGLVGQTYSEALFRFQHSSLIGIQYQDGRVQLNPPPEAVIQVGDKVVAIGKDDAAIDWSGVLNYGVDADAICDQPSSVLALERLMILGWNRRAPLILEQLDYYMPPGSQVLVLAPVDPQQMQSEAAVARYQRLQVTFEEGTPFDFPTLERLTDGGYQYIVILSRTDAPDIQIADAMTMVSLISLRDIARTTGQKFSIVSEILDVRNRDLAEVTSADDLIISERLVAMAMAQIAENKDVQQVLAELLSPGGPEIYLKPVEDYLIPDRSVNFYTVLAAARRQGQTAIGYRLLAEANKEDRAFGVHLNPDKSATFTLSANDRVIVLGNN